MVGKMCTPSQSFSYYTITQYSLCIIYKDIQQAAILLAYGSICYTVESDSSSMLTSLGMKFGLSVSSRSLSSGMFWTKSLMGAVHTLTVTGLAPVKH